MGADLHESHVATKRLRHGIVDGDGDIRARSDVRDHALDLADAADIVEGITQLAAVSSEDEDAGALRGEQAGDDAADAGGGPVTSTVFPAIEVTLVWNADLSTTRLSTGDLDRCTS